MRHKGFWIAFGIGALAGAVAALLYAPQSGEKTRKKLKQGFEDAGDALQDAADYLKEQAERLGKETQRLVGATREKFGDVYDSAGDSASGAFATAAKSVKEVQQRLV